jgi:hypothetical protein
MTELLRVWLVEDGSVSACCHPVEGPMPVMPSASIMPNDVNTVHQCIRHVLLLLLTCCHMMCAAAVAAGAWW